MAQVGRLKVNWTGFIGAPGYTNLHFRDFPGEDITQEMADGFTARVDTWLDTWAPFIPDIVSFTVDPSIDILDEETADLVDFMTVTPDPTRNGNAGGNYSAPSGACVNWSTGGIKNGRRIRGRTFMVPLAASATDAQGTLSSTLLTAIRASTATFLGTGPVGILGVYSRPTVAAPTSGQWAIASSFSLPDRVAVLRSRRD